MSPTLMKRLSALLFLSASVVMTGALSSCQDRSAPDAAAGVESVAALPLSDLGPAPEWTLRDVNGAPVSSKDFAGKVMVVDFWATWCAPCKEEIPGYMELQKKYADRGLVILGLSVDAQGPGVVKSYATSMGINYPLLMADSEIMGAFGGVEAIPTTFLIDRDGRVRHKKIGAAPTAEYEKLIAGLLN